MLAGCCLVANRAAVKHWATPPAASWRRKRASSAVPHHVFVADIEASAIARPAQEIAHCAWFDRQTIASIDCSRPTPFIVKRALKILDDERYVMAYMEAMLLQAAA